MFDQRMLRPSSDHYYFQLVPTLLTITNPAESRKIKSQNSCFRLKLMKGLQFSDQIKKAVAARSNQGKIAFEKAQLNFYLPSFNPNRDVQFTLILLQENENEEEAEVGRCGIMSSQYIVEFKQSERKEFGGSVSLGDKFKLNFELYIHKTRYDLEKFIREARELKKEDNRNSLKEQGLKNSDPKLNQAKSEVLSGSEQANVMISGENRFMSPTRRIARKHGERKLLMKNSSPQRSQGKSDSNSQKERNLKFLRKGSPKKEEPPQMALASQEVKKMEEEKKKETLRKELEKKKEEEERKRKEATEARKRQEEDRRRKEAADVKKRQAEQRRKEAEVKRKEEQSRQKEKQRTQIAKREAEARKLESQRKREEQQSRRAAEQEEKRKQAERVRREEERKRKLEESKRARLETSQQNQSIKSDSKFKRAAVEVEKPKQQPVNRSNESSRRVNRVSQKNEEVDYTVDVLAESVKPVKKVFKWEEPVKFKKTDSGLFNESGNKMTESSASSTRKQKKSSQMDIKTKVFMVVFMFISLLLLINAMSPSKRF